MWEIGSSSWFYYKEICDGARSHVTVHGHMNVKFFFRVCPTVCLDVSLQLPLDEFPSDLLLETFMKICREISNFVKIGKNYWAL